MGTDRTASRTITGREQEGEDAIKEIEKLRDLASKPSTEQLTLQYIDHSCKSVLGLDADDQNLPPPERHGATIGSHSDILVTNPYSIVKGNSVWNDLKSKIVVATPSEQVVPQKLEAAVHGQRGACQTRLESMINASSQKPTQDQLKALQLVADHLDAVQAAKASTPPKKSSIAAAHSWRPRSGQDLDPERHS